MNHYRYARHFNIEGQYIHNTLKLEDVQSSVVDNIVVMQLPRNEELSRESTTLFRNLSCIHVRKISASTLGIRILCGTKKTLSVIFILGLFIIVLLG